MKKRKILIICPYPENVAPSQRLKYEQYFEDWKANGWEITVSPFISAPFWKIIYDRGKTTVKLFYTMVGYWRRLRDVLRAGRYHVVYIHLWATPFGPPFFERLFRSVAKKLIYDIDDLVYLKNTKSKAHPMVTFIKGRQKPIYLMKVADHVITCTPHLDNFVRKYNNHTTDISSTVDVIRYLPVNKYENHGPVTLGWSGSLSTSQYFYLLANVLRQLKQRYDVRILAMGDPSVSIDGLDVEALAWRESEEIKTLQRMDIGLYPLPDEEWVLGKSGLKAIQYMALGIPTVASAIGANFRVIEDGVSGFLVKTEEEWLEVLSRLIEEPDLRYRIGINGRNRIQQFYSVDANKTTYRAILDE